MKNGNRASPSSHDGDASVLKQHWLTCLVRRATREKAGRYRRVGILILKSTAEDAEVAEETQNLEPQRSQKQREDQVRRADPEGAPSYARLWRRMGILIFTKRASPQRTQRSQGKFNISNHRGHREHREDRIRRTNPEGAPHLVPFEMWSFPSTRSETKSARETPSRAVRSDVVFYRPRNFSSWSASASAISKKRLADSPSPLSSDDFAFARFAFMRD